MEKTQWASRIISVQPRIRLTRSFDQRSHSYLGYCLIIDGVVGGEQRDLSIGVGKATHAKLQFQVGDEVSGESLPVADARQEPVEYYKTSKLQVLSRGEEVSGPSPPLARRICVISLYMRPGVGLQFVMIKGVR